MRSKNYTFKKGVLTVLTDDFKVPKEIMSEIKSVIIEDGVTRIGELAFCECRRLTDVTIPKGVTSIGNAAFCNCTELKNVTIPASVTRIENQTFSGCSSLTSVTIPKGVTRIGIYAFCGCRSLTSVTIPSSVKSIGFGAFYNCTSLTKRGLYKATDKMHDRLFRGGNRKTADGCKADAQSRRMGRMGKAGDRLLAIDSNEIYARFRGVRRAADRHFRG
ncbi:MAG: leucine-rich repeat domain-containing protein [Clostridiales bacterium]|nr:leucine-rich repeat domain-containing protein [Clostridiales bacterium]